MTVQEGISYVLVWLSGLLMGGVIWGWRPAVAERPDMEALRYEHVELPGAESPYCSLELEPWPCRWILALDYAAFLERAAGEREQHYEAMYQRQADAVRHHTDRADKLADRLAQAERDLDAAQKKCSEHYGALLQSGHEQVELARELAAAREALAPLADEDRWTWAAGWLFHHDLDGGDVDPWVGPADALGERARVEGEA